MFIAEVDFVPDLMMNLARKEILDGGISQSDGGDPAGGSRADEQGKICPRVGGSIPCLNCWLPMNDSSISCFAAVGSDAFTLSPMWVPLPRQ